MPENQPHTHALYTIWQHGVRHDFECSVQEMPVERILSHAHRLAAHNNTTIVDGFAMLTNGDIGRGGPPSDRVFFRIPSYDAIEIAELSGWSIMLDHDAVINLDEGRYRLMHINEYTRCELPEVDYDIPSAVRDYADTIRTRHQGMQTLAQLMHAPLPRNARLVCDYDGTLLPGEGHSLASLSETGRNSYHSVLEARVKNVLEDDTGSIYVLTDVEAYWLRRFTDLLRGNAYYYDCKVALADFDMTCDEHNQLLAAMRNNALAPGQQTMSM